MVDRESINQQHGGNLSLAVEQFGIPENDWLDLSTGIAPWGYDKLQVPQKVWQRLPSAMDDLVEAAASYYQCDQESVVPLSGSQQGITLLPQLFPGCRVAIPALGYFEHRSAWAAAGHFIVDYEPERLEDVSALVDAGEVDVVVVINPNNPTTTCVDKNRLLDLLHRLQSRGGHLVVDEAFGDSVPQLSLAPHCHETGLVVLRSIGKFFGLAGLRLGFLLAAGEFIQRASLSLHCWHISGPAEYLGAKALRDQSWQVQQRQKIQQAGGELTTLLGNYLDAEQFRIAEAPLFCSLFCEQSAGEYLFKGLAQRGIWLRRFQLPEQQYCLRLGLPGNPDEYQRLQQALEEIYREH